MSDKPKVLGTIKIDILEGGQQEATFTGLVEPNDVFALRITLQTQYAQYLNERSIKEQAAGAEAQRVKKEKEAAAAEKQAKIDAEKEANRVREEKKKEVDAAKKAEVKAKKRAENVEKAK